MLMPKLFPLQKNSLSSLDMYFSIELITCIKNSYALLDIISVDSDDS